MIIAPCQTVRAAEQAAFAAGETSPAALTLAVVGKLEAALRPYIAGLTTAVVYAGKGNNAMDAVGLAARLMPQIILRCAPGADKEKLIAMAAACGQTAVRIEPEPPEPAEGLLLLDGLLGSGARGELSPDYADAVAEMNALRASSERALSLAIDIPTGLQADSGEIPGIAVQADITCPIGCVKPGLLADHVADTVGRLLPVPLPGIPLQASCADRVLSEEEAMLRLPRRAYTCFKNRAGRVAIVAGSVGMLGAARLCAEAALAAGAGLVVLYCHRDTYALLAASVAPEVMVRPVDSYGDIREEQAQALVLGPGLGKLSEQEAGALHDLAQSFSGTVVLDADALNLAAAQHWNFTPNMILTPHPGEMRRLDPRPPVSRRETAQRFLEQHDVTLLLKGARSLIADRRACWYNTSGGPYMANGGQGDALAGVIGALAAQGCTPLQAAAAGAYRCGRAAERAFFADRGSCVPYPPSIPASQVISHYL